MKAVFLKVSAPLALAVSALAAAGAIDYVADGKLWWAHVQYLADDKLEGRNVGTPGFAAAVKYVEDDFQQLGLKPAGAKGFEQPVPLQSVTLIPEQSSLALVRDGQETPLTIGADATLSARADLAPELEAPLVFVGRGFSIPDYKYDDLAGLDLHGKIAVYWNGGQIAGVPGPLMSHLSSGAERWNTLKQAGAIGAITLGGRGAAGGAGANAARSGAAAAGEGDAAGANPPAGDTAAAPDAAAGRGGRAGRGGGRGAPQPSVSLSDPDLQDTAGMKVSATLTAAGAAKLLEGSGHTYEELQQAFRDNKPLPRFELKGALRMKSALKRETLDSVNVAAMYPGSDSKLKNEYVIMSAHLDHLGRGRAVNGDDLYNGAMDNASGVASVLEVARLLKESKAKLKRSVIFVTVTGEEKGELGSRYFAAKPTVPRDSVVADINLDMFLPLYPLKVIEVQGLVESTLGEQVTAAADGFGVRVQVDQEPEQNRFTRSDQYSFVRQGIPALAFKFGYDKGSPDETIRRNWVRDIYHKPADDTNQKIDAEAAARFDRVILALIERVANDPARPKWKDDSFFKRFAKSNP
jgi:hypothetical protein